MAAKIQKSSNLGEIWLPSRLWCCELIWSLVSYGGHFESKRAVKIQQSCDLDEIWLPSRLRCCELKSIVCFVMVAILNTKWPPKYKNPPIWTKCGFQVDYHVANWYESLVCYDGHFESKMAAKIKNPPIWKKFDFQVDYDVANWYESLVCYGSHFVNGLRLQWKLISRNSLKGGIGWCTEFWYGCRLGTSVFASKHKQTYPANT